MSDNTFEKIKWFVGALISFNKSSYPLTKIGAKLIVGSPIVSAFVTIIFSENFIISSLELSVGEASLFLTFIGVITGLFLIYTELSSTARHTARVLITGLPDSNADFPEEVLSKTEVRKARESVRLGEEESKDGDSLDAQIKRFNSEVCVDLFNRFIVHDKCRKLYIGGLARVPFLVAYGSLLRALHAEVIYFDKFSRGGSWKKLNEENQKITLKYDDIINVPNADGDIGLALGFTTPIKENQLPEMLKSHTTIISPSVESDRNLIKNQENLENISSEIQRIVDKLSASDGVQRIHLFLSVQSTLAIQIGRKYQEGIHRNWIVHNFNSGEGGYSWALELSKQGVQRYSRVA